MGRDRNLTEKEIPHLLEFLVLYIAKVCHVSKAIIITGTLFFIQLVTMGNQSKIAR